MKNIKSKSAVSMILVAVVIVIIIIAAVAGAYYYTTTQTPSTSPSPSPSATATPSTSPSASPSASPSVTPGPTALPIANFHAGAYANYTITTYDNVTGLETSSMPFNWAVSDGNTNWVLTMSTTVTSDNTTTDSLLIYNIDKATNQPTSARIEAVSGGIVIINETIDLSSPTYNTTGSAEINPNTIVGQESITVAAGTFNCEKAVTTETGTTSTVWINSNIPIWGIVKMTTTEGTTVTSKTELISYG